MTPRQIRSEMLLLRRRELHRRAEELSIVANGSRGDMDQTNKLIENWSKA